MIVIDASAVVEWLLATDKGRRLAARVLAGPETLHAPHLIRVEVVQALRKAITHRLLTPDRASEAVDDLQQLPLRLYPHEPFISRMWELRSNASAYDAAYLVLAEVLDVPLLSADARMAGIPGHRVEIEVV